MESKNNFTYLKTAVNLISPSTKDLMILNFLLNFDGEKNRSYEINYYSSIEDFINRQDFQSILFIEAGEMANAVNQGHIHFIDVRNAIIYKRNKNASHHAGIPIYNLYEDLEVIKRQFGKISTELVRTKEEHVKDSYLVVRLGETYHWIKESDIDQVETREGLTFVVLKNGTEYPMSTAQVTLSKNSDFDLQRTDEVVTEPTVTVSYNNGPRYSQSSIDYRSGMRWFLLLIVSLIIGCKLMGQSHHLYNSAVELSHQGDYNRAENIFAQIASDNKELSSSFILARAYNYSWSGKYDNAISLFKSLISVSDYHEEALVGLAYSYSWSAQHAKAVQLFNQIMREYPSNRSGYFGQALNYLSVENPQGAQYILEQINRIYPNDPETHYLQGLIHLKQLHPNLARKSFKRSLELDPTFVSAKTQLDEIGLKASKFSIGAWYGLSSTNDETRNGFRRVDVQYRMNNKNTLYAYYDNSLLLDNSFVSEDKIASLISIGYKYGWNENLFSRLELGNRIFRDEANQYLIQFENVYFFSPQLVGQLNLQYDFRGSQQFGTLAAGLNVGLSQHIRLEGNYFYTHNMGNANIRNQRLVIGPKLITKVIELSAGTFYDWLSLDEFSSDQWSGYFFLGRVLATRYLEGQVLIQQDQGFFNNNAQIYSVGLTYKF